MLRNSLSKDASCYTSRAVVSNRASVINLAEKLNHFHHIDEFRSEMMKYFLQKLPEIFLYKLSIDDIKQAGYLADSKYKTWEWNWAYGPEYSFKNNFEISGIKHVCSLFIKDGIITESSIEGSNKLKNASYKLIGCRHMFDDLSEVFRNENIFLTEKEILNFF